MVFSFSVPVFAGYETSHRIANGYILPDLPTVITDMEYVLFSKEFEPSEPEPSEPEPSEPEPSEPIPTEPTVPLPTLPDNSTDMPSFLSSFGRLIKGFLSLIGEWKVALMCFGVIASIGAIGLIVYIVKRKF